MSFSRRKIHDMVDRLDDIFLPAVDSLLENLLEINDSSFAGNVERTNPALADRRKAGVVSNEKSGFIELVEFVADREGISLIQHGEMPTGEEFDDEIEVKLVALIQNNTNKTVVMWVTINFYDSDDIIVGETLCYSPRIKPGRSWKMVENTWVKKCAAKYDIVAEIRD